MEVDIDYGAINYGESTEDTCQRISWLIAAMMWVQTPIGRNWIPSDRNLLMLVDKIQELGLEHCPDVEKCNALDQAFAALNAEHALQSPREYLN
jgi:hypothetical protein